MTRVCIPTAAAGGLKDEVGEHFGRVPTYTIVDTESGAVDVVDNTSEHAGGQGLPADILAGLGIDVLLCQGAGRRALGILSENGIEVCVGVSGNVSQVLDAWNRGNLSRASDGDACQRHEFHDHSE
jgi:predicted Fe-Mo cluster-binding NifX family protein